VSRRVYSMGRRSLGDAIIARPPHRWARVTGELLPWRAQAGWLGDPRCWQVSVELRECDDHEFWQFAFANRRQAMRYLRSQCARYGRRPAVISPPVKDTRANRRRRQVAGRRR
jgi:hypothetical protein